MKVIAGLGNPGRRYRDTRHNAGFAAIDEIVRRCGLTFDTFSPVSMIARVAMNGERVLLVKPLTFMNLSGRSVSEVTRYYRVAPADLLVVTDDANLPLGNLRARARGSAGGHNGLRSIIESLGTEEFPRLRIGVGRGDERRDLADHVLARFEADEASAVSAAVARAAEAIELFVREDVERVMNEFNRNPEGVDAGTDESDRSEPGASPRSSRA